jgi:hypothetical protein
MTIKSIGRMFGAIAGAGLVGGLVIIGIAVVLAVLFLIVVSSDDLTRRTRALRWRNVSDRKESGRRGRGRV